MYKKSHSFKASVASLAPKPQSVDVSRQPNLEYSAAAEVKDKNTIEKLTGKYKPMRRRDFTSQISNLPGPKDILTREHHEAHTVPWKKKYDVRKRDNQAFISEIDDRFNAHKVDMKLFPSHKKAEVRLDPTKTRKGYALKQFILREKYDFLHPEKPISGKT